MLPHHDVALRITHYAHASFRLEADGLVVITDPYTPGPKPGSGFDPINEPADLVLMSSSTDMFHSDPSHILGNPVVIDTLEIPPEGQTVKGIPIQAFPAMESLKFDFQGEFGRNPDANALYLFTLGGLRVLHLGDTGNPIPAEQIEVLRGNVDIMLALAGAHATIAYDDLDTAIKAIGPRVIIPMHFYHPRGWLQIEPVESFLSRYPEEIITRINGPTLELTPATLPPKQHIYVLEQAR